MTASLALYAPDTVENVEVTEGQTTGDIDFALSLLPTTGFIKGVVELIGGSGDVTGVEVSAGSLTVYPDENGYYLLEIIPGIYDVIADLEGYYTEVIHNVPVVLGDTASGIDFTLYSVPVPGSIQGIVTLYNGSGDVTLAEVTARTELVHPSPDGHYTMEIDPGTYTVIATHPYALPDSVAGVTVPDGQTVNNINLELEIVRTDLVCKAVDNFGHTLDNVNVEVTGPEGTYSGIIESDSLIIENVPYGSYNGSAWMEGGDTVYLTTDIGPSNHHMIFMFDLTGLKDNSTASGHSLKISPNPSSGRSVIRFSLPEPGTFSLKVFSILGLKVKDLSEGWLCSREHSLIWDGRDDDGNPVTPGVYLILLIAPGHSECIETIRK